MPTEKDWTGVQNSLTFGKPLARLDCLSTKYGAMKKTVVVGGGGCSKTARAGPACHVIVFQFVFRLKLHIIIPIPILQSLLRQLYLPLVVTFGTNCASPSCPHLCFLSIGLSVPPLSMYVSKCLSPLAPIHFRCCRCCCSFRTTPQHTDMT